MMVRRLFVYLNLKRNWHYWVAAVIVILMMTYFMFFAPFLPESWDDPTWGA